MEMLLITKMEITTVVYLIICNLVFTINTLAIAMHLVHQQVPQILRQWLNRISFCWVKIIELTVSLM